MSDSSSRSMPLFRAQIVGSLDKVRPLPTPSRRTLMLAPIACVVAVAAPLVNGERGDLGGYAPLLTWGFTGVQLLCGLIVLALAFREAVPGRNVSRRALAITSVLAVSLIVAMTELTNAASATVVPPGREWRYWAECVVWPMAVGAPFVVAATLMVARAFPTRPAIAGALCGLSAGILSESGWRLSCWISDPTHVFGSHGLAILGLTLLGSFLSVAADIPRWKRPSGSDTAP